MEFQEIIDLLIGMIGKFWSFETKSIICNSANEAMKKGILKFNVMYLKKFIGWCRCLQFCKILANSTQERLEEFQLMGPRCLISHGISIDECKLSFDPCFQQKLMGAIRPSLRLMGATLTHSNDAPATLIKSSPFFRV